MYSTVSAASGSCEAALVIHTLIDQSLLLKSGAETCDIWTLKLLWDVVMVSQRLWHHMGLIIAGWREGEVCRERSEADGGGGVGFFFFFFLGAKRTELCVC